MNKLPHGKRVQILHLLVEGTSLRATARIVDCSLNTVMKLLIDLGVACDDFQRKTLRNLPCKTIQVDEIWSFIYAKDKHLPEDLKDKEGYGSVWTWAAICPVTKLVPVWYAGARDTDAAIIFLEDLRKRFRRKFTIVSDGFVAYVEAMGVAFRGQVNFARYVKQYENRKYVGAIRGVVTGTVDDKDISTSIIERQNLTMRTQIKRFTRRTNAHSKRLENHRHALAIHYMYYNFCRIHSTIRVTPAMEAKITDHVWSLDEMLGLLD